MYKYIYKGILLFFYLLIFKNQIQTIIKLTENLKI